MVCRAMKCTPLKLWQTLTKFDYPEEENTSLKDRIKELEAQLAAKE